MEKLGLLLLTLVALLHLKTSLAGGVAQGDIGRPRPGECPRELRVAPSKMGCKCDEDCPRGHKCCKFKCGTACIPPILTVCPWNNWGMGLCAELCHDDSDCQDPILSKCCSNGCGHQCTAPYIVKAGVCGPPKGTYMCAEYCTHDGNCPGDQKCCRTTCGHACSKPC